jgi:hypothetical protein
MQLSCTVVQMWESPELVPHEVSGRVYLRINFKLHIYFAVRKIICGSMTVPDCLAEVYSVDRHPSLDCQYPGYINTCPYWCDAVLKTLSKEGIKRVETRDKFRISFSRLHIREG